MIVAQVEIVMGFGGKSLTIVLRKRTLTTLHLLQRSKMQLTWLRNFLERELKASQVLLFK